MKSSVQFQAAAVLLQFQDNSFWHTNKEVEVDGIPTPLYIDSYFDAQDNSPIFWRL